jgi:hypothetical protein
MAPYPWVVPWKRQQQNLDDFVIARVVLFRASDQSGSERISVSGEQWQKSRESGLSYPVDDADRIPTICKGRLGRP